MSGSGVAAVVPVKRLGSAKSRLRLPAQERTRLALAFALDTIGALAASPAVATILVVTSDPVLACQLRAMRIGVVPDDATDLDGAVGAGIEAAASRWTGLGVAVVMADLPTLRPADVAEVLRLAAVTSGVAAGAAQGSLSGSMAGSMAWSSAGAFVPDHAGTGTTMVLHPPGQRVRTRYGQGSAARHSALGLVTLTEAPIRARQDVDTLEDLDAAVALGVGPRTATAVATLTSVRPA